MNINKFTKSGFTRSPIGLRLASDRGFALLAMTIGLPIFITFLFWMSHRVSHYIDLKNLRHHCRSTLIRTQEGAGKGIERLLDLNRLVKAAKLFRKAAEAVYYASFATGNPAIIRAAKANLDYAKAQQKALRLAQRTIIATTTGHMNFAYAEVMKTLMQTNAESARRSHRLYKIIVTPSRPKRPHLAIKKKNAKDEFPEYVLDPKFEERQALQLRWQVRFLANSSHEFHPFASITYPDACGVTLTRELKPVFHQDRFFYSRGSRLYRFMSGQKFRDRSDRSTSAKTATWPDIGKS